MKIHRMVQGTPEWLAVRAGIPTASEFNSLVTPVKRQPAKCDGYLYQKLAERWLGRPLDDRATSFAMEQGKILEEHAIPFYELEHSCEIERVGFVTTDDGRYGCSPDGFILSKLGRLGFGPMDDLRGAEFKCPKAETHAAYLINGTLPTDYLGQVQGSMLVTGAPCWTFMSYCRGFPPLILTVERDEQYLRVLRDALEDFTARLDEEYQRLVEINGGEPVRTPITVDTVGDVTTKTLEGAQGDIDDFLNSKAFERLETL